MDIRPSAARDPVGPPPAGRLGLLRWQFDVAWALLELHLSDLTDDECLWQPATPCWTVRRRADGRWAADWQVPAPDPGPASTIGWLTWHIGFWWSQTYAATFGDGRRLGHDEVFWPGDAEACRRWLADLRRQWVAALEALHDSDLDAREPSKWFLRGTRSLGYVIAWVNSELMKNAAELGAARRLYALSGRNSHPPDRLAS